jgi:hypothetical protein
MLFAISSDPAGGVYFGHEQVPATMNEWQYAEVLAELQARPGNEASADWTPVMINGQGAMRLALKSLKDPDTTAEITIVLRGRDAWWMVTFLMKGKKRDEVIDTLETAVFGTIEWRGGGAAASPPGAAGGPCASHSCPDLSLR